MSKRELVDSYGRRITYLRLSVTDQCQFRCIYCMPPEGVASLPRADYMTPDEMEQFVRAVADLGVWRLRLTGGEPLIRKDIVSLVERFSRIEGITDLALTTNAELLAPIVTDLQKAGLNRINISLDSLDPARFTELTLSNSFDKVWNGIEKSLEAGLKIKLNVVVMKGISTEEIDGFARLAFENPIEIRFIEFMPLCGTGWRPDLSLPIDVVRSQIAQSYNLQAQPRGSEVAESYRMVDGKGAIGYIASMTEPFCSTCSRIRISATGRIQLCLFSSLTYNMLPILRRGASLNEIQDEVCKAVMKKPESHPWANGDSDVKPEDNATIRTIGG